jgi:hypothetical protein
MRRAASGPDPALGSPAPSAPWQLAVALVRRELTYSGSAERRDMTGRVAGDAPVLLDRPRGGMGEAH